jgi:hypothetical protein
MRSTIPFTGFYESIHSDNLEQAIEQGISDSSGCGPVSDRIANDIWMHYNSSKPEIAYVQAFVESFQAMFVQKTGLKVAFKFENMTSPREYNFQTDRIFVTLSREHVRQLRRYVDTAELDKQATERFTSCDGFISFYSPDYTTWGPIDKWDANQVGTLVEACMKTAPFDESWEWDIVEYWSGNGYIDDWMYEGLDKEGIRLMNIAHYLRQREERAYSNE